MQNFTVSVPCKSYIKKYFCGLYGSPVIIDPKNEFGDTILTKLAGNPLSRLKQYDIALTFRDYNDHIKFQLPMDLFYRIDNMVSEKNIYTINRYLEKSFESDLFHVVTIASCFQVSNRGSIEAFLQKYNIILEEDITYGAIKKKYYRIRNRPNMANNFLVALSRSTHVNLRA